MTIEERMIKGLEKGWKSENFKRDIMEGMEGIAEERLKNGILNDVRQDAFEKLRSADDEEAGLLTDAALYIIALAKTAREEGVLYLDFLIEDLPEHLQPLIQMLVDAWTFEEIAEISTNDYWSRDPQGIQAMVSYIYIFGVNYIRKGYSPDAVKDALETLFPLNWRQGYRERCEKMEITEILPKYGSV